MPLSFEQLVGAMGRVPTAVSPICTEPHIPQNTAVYRDTAQQISAAIADPKPATALIPELLAAPDGLKVAPWAHQLRGYSTLLPVLQKHGGCLLAAEMGVGKTLIATMLSLGVQARRTLIVCPLRVISSWRVQLGDYLAGSPLGEGSTGDYVLTLLDDSMTVAKRVRILRQDFAESFARRIPHYVVVNYDSYWRPEMSEVLLEHGWDVVIYDESHKLKNVSGRASNMAKRLAAKTTYRILATGTPLAHSPLDAFGQLRAAVPGLLGTSYVTFKNRYATWAGPHRRIRTGFQNIAELESRLAPVTWRATKEEVLPDLPEALPPVIYECELSQEGAKAYRDMEQKMIAEYKGGVLTATNVLTQMLRLQQMAGGSMPLDDKRFVQMDTAKERLLKDVLEDLGEQPVVVFARFRSDLDAIHRACDDLGIQSREVSGERNQLESWQAGDGQVLAVQAQSGSVGINLTRASVAIYYSLSQSLALWDQSQARIHRPGQKNACTFIYLCSKGTIDGKILAALMKRQDVIEAIMTNIQAKASQQ